MQQLSRRRRRDCSPLCFAVPILFLGPLLLTSVVVSESTSKPTCEDGRLTLRRDDLGTCAGEEVAEAAVTRTLSEHIHEALMAWSGVPGGCKGTVVFEGADHCGQVRFGWS